METRSDQHVRRKPLECGRERAIEETPAAGPSGDTRSFIFGDRPTLADAALYGQCAMLRAGDAALPSALSPALGAWIERVEATARR